MAAEWDKLRQGTAAAVEGGYVELQQVSEPTLGSLTDHLRAGECHVFHFIGHGAFLEGQEVGALLMQDDQGRPRLVTGEALGSLLWGYERDLDPPRLVVLNACEGARTGAADPFAGVAASLVQQGMPVVVAMRTKISDRAAISFAEGFYRALSFGAPVEFALGQARWAIFTDAAEDEWATPVLYTRLPEVRPFDVQHLTEEQRRQAEREAMIRAFWNPTGATRVTVVFGKWPKALTERGEREDVVPLSFAMILGELRSFLSSVFEEVEMTDDSSAGEGTPVVALGGPLANELTARLAERYSPPVWFRGLPYESDSERSIGTAEDAFMPRIDEGGALMSDVGLVARIVEPDGRPVFIIAGCFGAGTLGATRYLYSADNLAQVQAQNVATGVEAVIRSQVSGWDVSATELVHVKGW